MANSAAPRNFQSRFFSAVYKKLSVCHCKSFKSYNSHFSESNMSIILFELVQYVTLSIYFSLFLCLTVWKSVSFLCFIRCLYRSLCRCLCQCLYKSLCHFPCLFVWVWDSTFIILCWNSDYVCFSDCDYDCDPEYVLDCVFKYDCDGVQDYNCNSEIDLTLLAIMTVTCSVAMSFLLWVCYWLCVWM